MYLGKFDFGKVIRRLRMERELSIESIAELIDEDPKFLRELEEGIYPDIELGIFFYLARALKMKPSELIIEIEKANIDFLNRSQIYERNKYELTKQRDKQRNLVLQKKRSHNFKNKHSKHQSNKKINIIQNKPTASIINLCNRYDIIPK